MNKKIKIITCYFGTLPEWMDIWLMSCGYNEEFDFLVVSDNSIANLPKNVSAVQMSLEDFREKISKAIGFEVALKNPYKICDYRPAFGIIFSEYLEGYDFWGHCDTDLIFGDLSRFITDDILDQYKRVGKYGHLILYKNEDFINNLYQKDGATFPYQKVFTDESHYGFDEATGINLIFKEQGIEYYEKLQIADSYWLLDRISRKGDSEFDEFYCFVDGHIFRVFDDNNTLKQEEFAYLHFQKKKPKKVADLISYEDGFYIKKDSLVPREKAEFTLEEVKRESEFQGTAHDKSVVKKNQMRRINDFLFKKNLSQKKIQLLKGYRYAHSERKK